MIPQRRWIGGLFTAGILGAAGVVLLPLLHRPSAAPLTSGNLQVIRPNAPPLPVLADAPRVTPYRTTAPPQLTPLPRSASLPERRKYAQASWRQHFPGTVLPYAMTGGGPWPGPPNQQLNGFTLEAQASYLSYTLGQTPQPLSGRTPRIYTELTVMADQPQHSLSSWELTQNGLNVMGDAQTETGVEGASFRPDSQGRQSAGISQSLEIKQGRHPKFVILHGFLRKSEDYEEPLTFRTPNSVISSSGMEQTAWQTQETPSGVKVTVPPQTMTSVGEPEGTDILHLNFQIDSPQSPAVLPQSPLYKKYHQPVLLRVGAVTPSGNAYDYPFSDPAGTMSLYKEPGKIWQYGSSPTVLTLVVQQRVYIREIPFALKVPVSHQPFQSLGRRVRVTRH